MSRAALSLSLVLLAGCAAAGAGTPAPLRPVGGGWTGWRALVDGHDEQARLAFEQALSADPRDAVAIFGRASLAFERGHPDEAFGGAMAVLEEAARADGAARALAPAAAVRAAAAFSNLTDRESAERRFLALSRAGLPWRAQVVLAELAMSIARGRADATLMAGEARRSGCQAQVTLAGELGRLPHLDLEATAPHVSSGERSVEATGCRLTVPAVEGHPGVRVLRAVVNVAPGDYDVALAFAGVGLLRVDGGRWHRHGSDTEFGPRWSALRVPLGAGPHQIEVRLGSYGGGTELMLAVLPATPTPAALEGDPLVQALGDVAAAIEDELLGDTPRALAAALRLTGLRHFALGLAAAGRVAMRDPSRPSNIGRDEARLLYRKAIAIDETLGRIWRELAVVELADERPREAIDAAERALRVSPDFWPAQLTLSEGLRSRGLERDADRVLAAATARLEKSRPGLSGCQVFEAALRRAQEQSRGAEEDRLAALLERCDPNAEALFERERVRGDLTAMEKTLLRRLATSADPTWVRSELAQVALARGQGQAAADTLAALVRAAPRDVPLRVRLADARLAAHDSAGARATITEALHLFPTRLEVRQAARALGLPQPLDSFRVDGRAIVRAFDKAAHHYPGPAVMVLDRSVDRVFPDGARMVLTHNIVRVQTKNGIERWGEIQIPDGAEVLTLRTHKPDGTIREPEDIVGKATISAPDLAAGDYVEWETVEVREASDAFAPGFLGDRFFFQSFDAPMDRSEYLLVTPMQMRLMIDSRAGAPAPVNVAGPADVRITRFAVRNRPQLFAERSAVPPIDWIPSVRVASTEVSLARWSRFISDQLYGVARTSPTLQALARSIAAPAQGKRALLPALLARWVNDHIEPEADQMEPATFSLARGRGNRMAIFLALGRTLGLDVDVVVARARVTTEASAPVVAQELDDFADVLVRFRTAEGDRFIHPRLRHAPFGYLPPALDGAPFVTPAAPPSNELSASGRLPRARSTTADARAVGLVARIDREGAGSATVIEELTGWPALEWTEAVDRAGQDRAKLRQDFEQRWLSQNFPGAVLLDLDVRLRDGGEGGARLQYSFTHPELASREGDMLTIEPDFFRSQPGRRYANEAGRRTALMLGFEVPLELDARFELPPGARVVDAGDSATVDAAPGVRFVERRDVKTKADGRSQIIVRRGSRLPLVLVQPKDYAAVAGKLRQVDALEQSEIRIALPKR